MNWAIKSDTGVVRTENQDRAAVFKNESGVVLAILCDGMGGHLGGSYAAQITIDTFEKEFKAKFNDDAKPETFFENTLRKSRQRMIQFAERDKNLLDMGTTVTAAIILEERVFIFNVGDSRTYAFNGLLHQVTKDHNLRNHYIDVFGYSPEEAAKVSGAMALTSALGPKKNIKVDSYIIKRSDILRYIILTCDGIHDYISKAMFSKIIEKSKELEPTIDQLIAHSIKGKSSDNLTVVIVDLKGDK